MKFILTPIDFSEGTSRVVDEAAKLAASIEAHLILLHVVRVPRSPGTPLDSGIRSKLVAAMETDAERKLLEIKADLLRRGVNAHSLRLTGDPIADIVDQAKKLNATCIVMGSHGHTAAYDLVIGSTVSGVVKRAGCSVVVVPLRKPAFGAKRSRHSRRSVPAVRL